MVDYPYEANFLQPLPRWPIQVHENTVSKIPKSFSTIRCDSGGFLAWSKNASQIKFEVLVKLQIDLMSKVYTEMQLNILFVFG